jgi:hypothetical protein
MKIGIAQIEAIREALMALPPASKIPNSGTKRGAVAALAPELLSLRRQGYGLETLAAFLKEKGLAISSGTLKNYLQRAGATRTKRRQIKIIVTQDERPAPAPTRAVTPTPTVRPTPSTPSTAPTEEQRAAILRSLRRDPGEI